MSASNNDDDSNKAATIYKLLHDKVSKYNLYALWDDKMVF